MSDETLKQIGKVPEPGSGRDAVHIAVVPVVAGADLESGCRVGPFDDGTYGWEKTDRYVGIVDPFLPNGVKRGTRFWLFLNPGSITSLRHVWTHPALPDEAVPAEEEESDGLPKEVVDASREWLVKFAEEHGESFDDVMAWSTKYQETGQVEVGDFTWMNYGSDGDFWSHWSVVTGLAIQRSGNFWTCEC